MEPSSVFAGFAVFRGMMDERGRIGYNEVMAGDLACTELFVVFFAAVRGILPAATERGAGTALSEVGPTGGPAGTGYPD